MRKGSIRQQAEQHMALLHPASRPPVQALGSCTPVARASPRSAPSTAAPCSPDVRRLARCAGAKAGAGGTFFSGVHSSACFRADHYSPPPRPPKQPRTRHAWLLLAL